MQTAISLVPAGVPVTSTNALGANLSSRRYNYTVPVLGRAEWAVLDMRNAWMAGPHGRLYYPKRLEKLRDRLDRSQSWRKVFERDGVLVFRKT